MRERTLIGAVGALIVAILVATVAVSHVRASDEYLASIAPINDLSTGTNAALTIDVNQGGPLQRWTLSGNVTITNLANFRSGVTYTIWFKQDATGSRTVAWPSNVKWSGGSAPTITVTAGKQDKILILWDQANNGFLAEAKQNF